MFRFYKDQVIADELAHRLENLGVHVELACACVKDHGQEQCVDFGDPCRAGVYLTVPTVYGEIMDTITRQVERGE